MCVDFTDLNKSYPNSSFSLPCIDQLVEDVSSYKLLSFIDIFSSYIQMHMHPPDEEKTNFITDEGTFCYNMIPFGLRNAKATY